MVRGGNQNLSRVVVHNGGIPLGASLASQGVLEKHSKTKGDVTL